MGESHYLSDLVRLLASKWMEPDDALCSVTWCSEFGRAVGGQVRGAEREAGTRAGLHLQQLEKGESSPLPGCVRHG